jgi:5-methylcytosine-specific restriction endonuclease McrA
VQPSGIDISIRICYLLSMSVCSERFATSSQRSFIYSREGGRCHYCQQAINAKGFHADHVQPWSRGGKTETSNLVASCYMCNVAKHTMAYEVFKNNVAKKGLAWRRKRYFAVRSNFSAAR